MTDQDHGLRQRFTHGLLLAGRHWRRAANTVVRAHGLSEATALPLVLIGRASGELRQTALAELAGIEGPSLVRLLDQLCAAGFVTRREDRTDRRAKILALTKAGERLVGLIEADLSALRDSVFDGLPPADFEAGLRLFQALGAHPATTGARGDERP